MRSFHRPVQSSLHGFILFEAEDASPELTHFFGASCRQSHVGHSRDQPLAPVVGVNVVLVVGHDLYLQPLAGRGVQEHRPAAVPVRLQPQPTAQESLDVGLNVVAGDGDVVYPAAPVAFAQKLGRAAVGSRWAGSPRSTSPLSGTPPLSRNQWIPRLPRARVFDAHPQIGRTRCRTGFWPRPSRWLPFRHGEFW